LHVSRARPDVTALFLDFLATDAQQSAALYILGDLFDAWLGDDDTSDFAQTIQQGLHQLTSSGVPVYFMAGNRDFMIGEDFAQATGVELLTDGSVVSLFGQPTLLLHGDTLCTADVGYQRFRRIIRAPLVTHLLKRIPLRWRMKIATKLRAKSATQGTLSAADLARMDATEQAVQQAFSDANVRDMIHGHTHRPNIHQHQLADGSIGQRIVLGDWYEQGSVLEFSREGPRLLRLPLTTG